MELLGSTQSTVGDIRIWCSGEFTLSHFLYAFEVGARPIWTTTCGDPSDSVKGRDPHNTSPVVMTVSLATRPRICEAGSAMIGHLTTSENHPIRCITSSSRSFGPTEITPFSYFSPSCLNRWAPASQNVAVSKGFRFALGTTRSDRGSKGSRRGQLRCIGPLPVTDLSQALTAIF